MGRQAELPELSRFERAALALTRFTNERTRVKRFTNAFHDSITRPWVMLTIGRRVFVDGIERLTELAPDRGVLLCSNHRSFFDMYVAMLALYTRGCPWLRRSYFPVRSNFFYERPAGVLINYLVGAGAMYPPIFRDRSKAAYNDDALDRLERFLAAPDVIVGMHPEGTRNKGEDPYTLLPAQPGVGQIALRAKPIVVPLFVNGIGNDFVDDVVRTQRAASWRSHPVILVYGEPIDYADLQAKKPRLALYKQMSDRILHHVSALGERERGLRERIAAGELDDSPGWLVAGRGGRG
jgi:1-acyl-sn-glycerol-3-phosphate acyltransferase